MGMVFGPDPWSWLAVRGHRLNTLADGHGLRTVDGKSNSPPCPGLNTLADGHGLRTRSKKLRSRIWLVSIPSLMGMVFGRAREFHCRSAFRVSIPSLMGMVFGPEQYDLLLPDGSRLNTLADGHGLRTGGCYLPKAPTSGSQYPR